MSTRAGAPLTVHVQTVSRRRRAPGQRAGATHLLQARLGAGGRAGRIGLDRTTQWKPKDTLVGTASVTTDAAGPGQAALHARKRRASTASPREARDSRGNTITSATYTWVSDAATPGRDQLAAAERHADRRWWPTSRVPAGRHGAHPGHVAVHQGGRPADRRARAAARAPDRGAAGRPARASTCPSPPTTCPTSISA